MPQFSLFKSPLLPRLPIICLTSVLGLLAGCGADTVVMMTRVTWASPAAITYGTALSAAQLDATALGSGKLHLHPGCGDSACGRNPDAECDVYADQQRL